jgi:hypothetical protein
MVVVACSDGTVLLGAAQTPFVKVVVTSCASASASADTETTCSLFAPALLPSSGGDDDAVITMGGSMEFNAVIHLSRSSTDWHPNEMVRTGVVMLNTIGPAFRSLDAGGAAGTGADVTEVILSNRINPTGSGASAVRNDTKKPCVESANQYFFHCFNILPCFMR